LAPLALAACGTEPREAVAPPPIVAAKTDTPKPAPPVEEPPQAPPTPAPSSSPTPAPTPTPPAVLEETRSAPGAIPPSKLPDPNANPGNEPVDPLKWMQDSQARRADYERRRQAAEDEVASATTEVASREKILLEFKNPFLPRPQLPPDEAETIKSMSSNVDRVKWAQDKLAAANSRLADAQKNLADLKANPPLN
jgi:hypothetical protein